MKRKTLDKIAIGIFVVLLVGSLIINLTVSYFSPKVVDDGLGKYRSENIPEACRLPSYEKNVEEWKKNLRHNQETWYCLEYFE